MLWWQPNLVLDPEPSIHSDWSEFVEQLNVFFGQPISPKLPNVLFAHLKCKITSM